MVVFVLGGLAGLLWLAYMYVRMKLVARRLRAEGFGDVLELTMRGSVLSTALDALLPPRWLDRVPLLSSRRILQRISEFIADSRQKRGGSLRYVAVVSAFPTVDAQIHILDGHLARTISESPDTVDKRTEAYSVLEYFGSNLVTTRGAEWKRHRKVCTTAFSKSNLRLVKQTTAEQTDRLIQLWRSKMDSKTRSADIILGGEDSLMQLTMGVFARSIFGAYDMDAFASPSSTDASFSSRLMFTNNHLHVALVAPRWMGKIFSLVQRVHDAFDKMQEDMVAMLQSAMNNRDRTDLLSILSHSNSRVEPLSPQEQVADVWMFSLAGMETSAHTIGWMLARLSFLQPLQQQLRDEAGRLEDVSEMSAETAPLMFAVIHETLRLHPAVIQLPLLARQDTSFEDLRLKMGYEVVVNVNEIGLNPSHFANAETFDPTRFLDSAGNFVHNAGFVAFNVGPRACLGKQVALQEISIAMAKILQAFRVEPVKPFDQCMRWVTKVTREFEKPLPFRFVEM